MNRRDFVSLTLICGAIANSRARAESPGFMVGAWKRRSIREGTAPAKEPYQTIWLQGETYFADLRIPNDPKGLIRTMAGRVDIKGQNVSWTHELDNIVRTTPDAAVVERRGRMLYERGGSLPGGAAVDYEEIYELVSSEHPKVSILASRASDSTLRGIYAQIDDQRLLMVDARQQGGALVAANWSRASRVSKEWKLGLHVGDVAALPSMADPVAAGPVGTVIAAKSSDGLKWTVVEQA